MADQYFLLKRNSNMYAQQNRTWSVGDQMHARHDDYSSNSFKGKAWVWECTTGGTSTGTPTWPTGTVVQDTTTATQNGVVWTARKPSYSSGSTLSWAYAAPNESVLGSNLLYSAPPALGLGDRMIICIDKNYTPDPNFYQLIEGFAYGDDDYGRIIAISVDSTQGLPPLDPSAGAQTNGIGSGIYGYGLIYTLGTGQGSLSFNCTLKLAPGYNQFEGAHFNLTIDATNADATSFLSGSNARVFGGTYIAGAVAPDCLFNSTGNDPVFLRGLDLSAMQTTVDLLRRMSYETYAKIDAEGIKLPASYTGDISVLMTNTTYGRLNERLLGATHTGAFFNNTGNSTVVGFRHHTDNDDVITNDTTVYRSGGASQLGTAFSRKVVCANYVDRLVIVSSIARAYPGNAAEEAAWSEGTARTFTIHLVHDSQTGLKNTELFIHAYVMDDSGSRKVSLVSTQLSNPVNQTPTDLAASTETWAGTSGFTNTNKQKLTVTVNPRQKGVVYLDVLALKRNKTFYLCPKVEVS